MIAIVVCLCAGLAAALTLLLTLHRKVDALPSSLWKLSQRDRAADEKRALDALQEAAAAKVGAIVLALRQHQEALEAQLRFETGQADLRARISERRASDAGVALGAASALVATLRELVDDLPDLLTRAAVLSAGKAPPAVVEPADPAPGTSIDLPPQAAVETTRKPGAPEPVSRERPSPRALGLPMAVEEGDRPSAEEMTVVAQRPPLGTHTLASAVAPGGERGTP